MDGEKPDLCQYVMEKKKKKLEEEKEKLEREAAYYLNRRKSNKMEIMFRAAFLAIALYFVKEFWTGDIPLFYGDIETDRLFASLFLFCFGIPLTVLTVRSIRTYTVEGKKRKECVKQIEDLEDEINNLAFKMMLLSSNEEKFENEFSNLADARRNALHYAKDEDLTP